MTKRAEKKSETIEVRVSYTEKLAFMEACRQAGTTASHAIRDYIGDFLNPASNNKTGSNVFVVISIALVASLTATTVYLSLNQPNPITIGERMIRYFDENGDHVITTQDTTNLVNKDTINWLLETGDQNGDGQLGVTEVNALANVTIELRGTHLAGSTKSNGEKIIVIPPNLTPKERQEFLEQYAIVETVSTNDQDRLVRLINALSTPKAKSNETN